MSNRFGIVIHGGAGSYSKTTTKNTSRIKENLHDILQKSFVKINDNWLAVNVVEYAVKSMENSGIFNAGMGSCLTIAKNN